MNDTLARLRDAMNEHDAHAMAACFASDYSSEQPVHPNRGFGGYDQVAANWSRMFAAVPDLTCDLVAEISDGDGTWSEWDWRGHYDDGSEFRMRGITRMRAHDDGTISWMRLYMEPVEQDSPAIDEAVGQLTRQSR